MDSTKTSLIPGFISVCLIIIVEICAPHISLSPVIATGCARTLEILILLGVYHLSANGIAALGMSPGKIRHGIIRGFSWSLVFGLICGLLGIALIFYGVNPLKIIHMTLPDSTGQIVIFYIVGGIIGPAAEEIFFRGLIYGHLRDQLAARHLGLGIATALTVSTLLFVLSHSGSSGLPFPQLVGGIVFCLSYEKEKSLLTPMIIHSSGNMAIFTLSLISK